MGSLDISIVEVIRAKRDGKELSENQIKTFISKLVSNDKDRVHESQIGAFLMAIFLNGLSHIETSVLTKAMTYSGYTFDWPASWKGFLVDKHSTGGVGDKVSLVLAPALAACGLKVPMVSGRGLDFTGGTLDKLESIPGFNVSLSRETMIEVLESVGCCIVGQTEELVPADKLLYSIRDTTATVDNVNLIVASIISKKAAENLDALVLDVKVGDGALMKDLLSAKTLATNLVKVGNSFGMKVRALITQMDTPLGNAIGNSLEVAEAIETLQNEGPQDLLDLVAALGGKLLESTGQAENPEEGKRRISESIQSGAALRKMEGMMVGQGTLPAAAHELCFGDKWKQLPKAASVHKLISPRSGYIQRLDSLSIARVCHGLGCGRSVPGQPVKYEPGILLRKKLGDPIEKGDTILEIHYTHCEPEKLNGFVQILEATYEIGMNPIESKLILAIVE